jgi:hypothetical protein
VHGERIILADLEYINENHQHKFYCREHGEFPATLKSVLKTKSGSCPGCCPQRTFTKGIKIGHGLTKAHFESVIVPALAAEPGYQLMTQVEEYGGGTTDLNIHHVTCSKEFPMRWSTWKNGARCPNCRPTRAAHNRKSNDEIQKLVAAAHDGHYRLLETFKGMNEPHKIIYNITRAVIQPTIDNFLRGKFRKPVRAYEKAPVQLSLFI